MANAATSVKVCWAEACVKIKGRMTAITPRRINPLLFALRAHRSAWRRAGIGRALGVKAKTS
jgi:hypothetical protein